MPRTTNAPEPVAIDRFEDTPGAEFLRPIRTIRSSDRMRLLSLVSTKLGIDLTDDTARAEFKVTPDVLDGSADVLDYLAERVALPGDGFEKWLEGADLAESLNLIAALAATLGNSKASGAN